VELFDFFSTLKCRAPSPSAFVQRRQLIKPLFFRDFFHQTAQIFYRRFSAKNWRGFRLLAVDGTGLRLPNARWIGEAFGWHQNQYRLVPSVRWLLTFDLLNRIIVDVQLHARQQGEITVAGPLVSEFPKDALVIYDRGFASYAIPYLHQLHGSHCLIRLKTNFSPTVADFVQSGDKECLVTTQMTERAVRTLRRLGYPVSRKTSLHYRLIRVDLPTGETEVLLTTLLHRRHVHHRHFSDLYRKRWGVETAIFVLKSFFQAAVFSSYTCQAVEQEIWALFALYNLQSMLLTARQKQLERINKRRQFNYQINRNVTIGLIKRFVSALFLREVKAWRAKIHALLDELLRHLEPIRPRPGRTRVRKIMRGTERHIYESNYKPTI
jgi:hypothetical protein